MVATAMRKSVKRDSNSIDIQGKAIKIEGKASIICLTISGNELNMFIVYVLPKDKEPLLNVESHIDLGVLPPTYPE